MNEAPILSKDMSALVHALGGGHPLPRWSQDGRVLTLVTVYLARCKEHPDGCRACGYQILAPLDTAARLEAEKWSVCRKACIVRRFWQDEDDLYGHLVHRRGGRGGAAWCFTYPQRPEENEEGMNFQDRVFALEEYVSVRGPRGDHTFRVVNAVRVGNAKPFDTSLHAPV